LAVIKQVDGRLLPAQIHRLLKSAQEEKRRSEERFQIIADNASVMLWVSNADGAVTFDHRQVDKFRLQPNDSTS